MDKLTFYFDRTFGKRLPRALERFRGTPFEVRHHSGEGHANTMPDDEWLAKAGQNRWVVLTQDYKFHKPGFEHEMAAIREHSVQCYYFPCAQETMWEAICAFVRVHKNVVSKTRASGPCFIHSIGKNGRIRTVFEVTQ